MDLTLRTESWGTDDQSWLGSRHGIGECASVTLDKSTFTLGTHYPNGYFKSGIKLAKITATGKYGPYDNAASDGREVFAGILFAPVPVSTSDIDPVGAMLDHGKVVNAKLVGGALDAAGMADAAGRIIFY
jgi:Bacteriophage lambda head decoration protein D